MRDLRFSPNAVFFISIVELGLFDDLLAGKIEGEFPHSLGFACLTIFSLTLTHSIDWYAPCSSNSPCQIHPQSGLAGTPGYKLNFSDPSAPNLQPPTSTSPSVFKLELPSIVFQHGA